MHGRELLAKEAESFQYGDTGCHDLSAVSRETVTGDVVAVVAVATDGPPCFTWNIAIYELLRQEPRAWH